MLRYLFLTGIILITSFGLIKGGSITANPVKPKLVVQQDSTVITPRYFNKTALKNYSSLKEFKYDNSYVGESPWKRFQNWFWSLFDTTQYDKTATGIIIICIKCILLGLGIAALVFLILRVAGVDALNIIKNHSMAVTLPYSESVENIYEIDLDTEIEKAIAQQNYRFAVRLLYLRCLKQLSDAELIQWDINKTNSIYINELTNPQQRNTFKMLTRQFEYVWYGEFKIDARVFSMINGMFNNFKVNQA